MFSRVGRIGRIQIAQNKTKNKNPHSHPHPSKCLSLSLSTFGFLDKSDALTPPWPGANRSPPAPPPASYKWPKNSNQQELYEQTVKEYNDTQALLKLNRSNEDLALSAAPASFSLHYPHPRNMAVTVSDAEVSFNGRKFGRKMLERKLPERPEFPWGGDERGAFAAVYDASLANRALREVGLGKGKGKGPRNKNGQNKSGYIANYSPTGISSPFTTTLVQRVANCSSDTKVVTVVSDPGGGAYGLRGLKEMGETLGRSVVVPEPLCLTKTNYFDLVEGCVCEGAVVVVEEGESKLTFYLHYTMLPSNPTQQI